MLPRTRLEFKAKVRAGAETHGYWRKIATR
jgi:hypothetical protein